MEEPPPRRRLPRLRRPRLPRRRSPKPPEAPKPPEPPQSSEPPTAPGRRTPFEPSKPAEAPRLPRPPKPPSDLWFRFTIRLRAIYYGIRELVQRAWRWLKRSGEDWVDWWTERSRATRRRILAVAGVAALYALIKFAPVPGVPCQISAAKECAPPDETIAFVPANAVLYAHLTLDSDSHQHELASELTDELPDAVNLLRQATSALPTPSGKPVDVSASILPWADGDLALMQVPGPGKSSPPAFIVGVGDRAGADQFLAGIAPSGKAKSAEQNGSPLTLYPGGFATAYSGDQLALRQRGGVCGWVSTPRRVAPRDSTALTRPRLATSSPTSASPRSTYPAPGCSGCWSGARVAPPSSRPSSTTARPTGVAASATAKDDGIEVNLVSQLDPGLLERSPTFFANLPEFEPDLAGEAGERALGYIGVGDVGPTLSHRARERRQPRPRGLPARCERLPGASGRRPGSIRSGTCCRRSGARRPWSPSRPTESPTQPDHRRRRRGEGGGGASRPPKAPAAGRRDPGRHRGAELRAERGGRGHGQLRADLGHGQPLLRRIRRQAGRQHRSRRGRPGALRRGRPGRIELLRRGDRSAPRSTSRR